MEVNAFNLGGTAVNLSNDKFKVIGVGYKPYKKIQFESATGKRFWRKVFYGVEGQYCNGWITGANYIKPEI